MNVDDDGGLSIVVVVILLGLGCNEAADVVDLLPTNWSSLPTSSSFTWFLFASVEDVDDEGASSVLTVGSTVAAVEVDATGCVWIGTGGRFDTTIWYWCIKAAEAFNIVCTFLSSLSRSSTCFRSLPSIARSSSIVSWSRFWGIGGGGIVYGAMKGIDGKKKGGGIAGPCGGNWGGGFAVEADAACWLPNPWLRRFKNGFCWTAAAGSLGLALTLTFACGCGCGCGAVIGVRKIFKRHVGHVCCRWNHDLKSRQKND